MGRRRIVSVVVGVVLVVIAAVLVVTVTRHRDTARAASADTALQRYRDSATSAGSTPIPPGVYTYATEGTESVSALGGTTHTYPATSTVTVTPTGCGADLRWDVLRNRWTRWSICRTDVDEKLASWTEHHQFFGRNDQTDWTCSSTLWLTRTPGISLPFTCRSPDTTLQGRTTVIGPETLEVGGSQVPVLHLRDTATENGSARGNVAEDRWLEAATGLPVRLTSEVRTANASPVGDVTFHESSDLRLTSLEPRR